MLWKRSFHINTEKHQLNIKQKDQEEDVKYVHSGYRWTKRTVQNGAFIVQPVQEEGLKRCVKGTACELFTFHLPTDLRGNIGGNVFGRMMLCLKEAGLGDLSPAHSGVPLIGGCSR